MDPLCPDRQWRSGFYTGRFLSGFFFLAKGEKTGGRKKAEDTATDHTRAKVVGAK